MKPALRVLLAPAVALSVLLAACTGEVVPSGSDEGEIKGAPISSNKDDGGHGHSHAEESLGSIEIEGMKVELAQGHGAVKAGKEGHLVVKLPYSDKGSTVVRAWIGTEDRTLSMVGKGTYDSSHDAYDIHATAPDPLPENVQWWIEIEKPDGTKAVGSQKPILE